MLRTCLGIIVAGLCSMFQLAGQSTFQKHYGGPGDDYGADVVAVEDGYVVAGRTNSSGAGGFDGMLMKVDLNGNVVWQNLYGTFEDDQFSQLARGNDGGLLAVGDTYGVNGNRDLWILKTDDMGNVQWNKWVGGNATDLAHEQGKILPLPDGYVISFIQYSTFYNGYLQTAILRIDNDGNVIWEKSYHSPQFALLTVTDVDLQNQVLYAGGSSDGEACLVHLDLTTGDVISARQYAGSNLESLYNVFRLQDGNLSLSDVTETPGGAQYLSLWLMKTTPEGDILWSKAYTRPGNDGWRGVAIPTPDGGFLATPLGFGIASESDASMIKMDESGAVQWAYRFGGADLDNFVKALATDDGGYLGVGYTKYDGNGDVDIFLVKVNADGLVEGCCKSDLAVTESEFIPTSGDKSFDVLSFFPPIDNVTEIVSFSPLAIDFCGATQPVLNDTIALCPGEPYDFEGTIFYAPDEATTLLPGQGCDTVLVTHFVLRQYVVSDFGVQLFCPGGFVTINGVVYDQPGTIMDTLTNHNGQFCDTIGIYTIVELPQVTLSDSLSYCPGDTIYYHGLSYAYPDLGLVRDTIPNTTGGCDTLVEVFLSWTTQDFVVYLDSVVCVNGNPVIYYRACNNGVSLYPPNNLYVTFYDANPFETTATPLGSYLANPISGECESLATSALPYSMASGGTIFAVINDYGTAATPYSLDDFPLTLVNECYYDNNLDSIAITPAPFVPLDLGPDVTLCVDSTVVFDAGPGYVSYLWQDGSTGSTFAAEDVGIYWVEVTDACGFVQRDSVFLTFSVLPDLKIPDQQICPSQAFQVSIPGFDTYDWAPANGLSCTDCGNPSIQPDVTTTYTIAAFSNLGCTFLDTFTVFVLPQISIQDTIIFCAGDTIFINGQAYFDSGVALDTLSGVNGACDTLVETLLIEEPLDLNIRLTEIACSNGGVVVYYDICNQNGQSVPPLWVGFYTQNPFDNTVSTPVYVSSGGSDSCLNHLSTPPLPQSFLGAAFIYAVVNDDGSNTQTPYSLSDFPITNLTECNYANNLDSIAVPAVAEPEVDLGPDVILCNDSTVVFNAGAGFVHYQWQDGWFGSTYTATEPGIYWVEVTDECGRKQRDSVLLTISLLPDIKFPDQELCAGESTTLSLIGYDTYEWAPGAGLSCTDCSEVSIQPSATTTYTVSAFSNLGCSFFDTIVVTVLPLPTRTEVIEFCKGDQVTLNGQVYTEPTVVTDTLASTTGGCDTLVTYQIQYLVPDAPVSLSISCPDDIAVQLNPGANSAVVQFTAADASSDCPCPGISLAQTSGLASGSSFPIGTTQICYAAADSCGNTANCCFNVSVNSAEIPCDVKVIGCMKYELLGISKDAGQNQTYRIRVTNNCANKLVYTAIQVPDGVVAIAPANASTYTSPAGRDYIVRNPNASPFHSVRFKPVDDGIANGASNIFEYTLPAQSNPTFIHITSRLETQTFYEAHLNTFGCPVTTQSNTTNRPATDRGLNPSAYAGLSVFPNPLSGSDLFADLADWTGQTVQIRVYDARGAVVLDQPFVAEDLTTIRLPEGLASGMFLLEVLPPDGNRQTARFVVAKP